MAFDITQLNQSSFRGIPFFTRDEELSSSQRLTDHTFINGGTETESNGLTNETFKISGYIGGDDYLTQKEVLREAFKDISSGTLIDKFYGSQEVFVEKYSIKESKTKFGQATIDVSFKLAKNEVVEDFDIVYTADVRTESIGNFKNEFNNEIGDELRSSIIEDIVEFWNDTLDMIKFVEDEAGTLQAIKSQIGGVISNIKVAILSIDNLSTDIESTWSSFDEVLDTTLFGSTEQKSSTNILREIIENSATGTFTNTAKATADRQSKTYINTVVAGLTQTAIKNLENVDFSTGDDLGSVKDDILTIFELLEKDIEIDPLSPIEEIVFKQELLNKYQLARREFIQFYTQKYSGLQELKNNEIIATTDIFNMTMEKYNDIGRSLEVLVNNDIVDPLFINGNLKLLDR